MNEEREVEYKFIYDALIETLGKGNEKLPQAFVKLAGSYMGSPYLKAHYDTTETKFSNSEREVNLEFQIQDLNITINELGAMVSIRNQVITDQLNRIRELEAEVLQLKK